MIRRAGFLMALSVASFLLFVGEAAAGTATVGQDFEAGNVICGSQTDLQKSVSSGNPYTVAAAGVITSWSFHNGIDVLPDLKLKVARPQSGRGYLFVGEAGSRDPEPPCPQHLPGEHPGAGRRHHRHLRRIAFRALWHVHVQFRRHL